LQTIVIEKCRHILVIALVQFQLYQQSVPYPLFFLSHQKKNKIKSVINFCLLVLLEHQWYIPVDHLPCENINRIIIYSYRIFLSYMVSCLYSAPAFSYFDSNKNSIGVGIFWWTPFSLSQPHRRVASSRLHLTSPPVIPLKSQSINSKFQTGAWTLKEKKSVHWEH
jgi:hypothetical protein